MGAVGSQLGNQALHGKAVLAKKMVTAQLSAETPTYSQKVAAPAQLHQAPAAAVVLLLNPHATSITISPTTSKPSSPST